MLIHKTPKRWRSFCAVRTRPCGGGGGEQTWNGQPLGHGLQGRSQDLVFRHQLVHQPDLQGLGGAVEEPQLQGQLRRPVAHRVAHGFLEPAGGDSNYSHFGSLGRKPSNPEKKNSGPKGGDDAELGLVQADAVSRVVRHHSVVAGH